MKGRPRVAILGGAGNLGTVLAISLHRAGYTVATVLAKSRGASLRRAATVARQAGAQASSDPSVLGSASVVWFCVPDAAIAPAALALAKSIRWRGKVALHSSGALTSDELSILQKQGAAVASVHPLMTFVRGSRPPLVDVPFALEGDHKAVRAARAIVRDLKGHSFTIRKTQKEAYHTWGMFASPLLTALLAATERVAGAAGVSPKTARQRKLPILTQTLANYSRLGAPRAFSGSIARGDVATVEKHLKVLQKVSGAREVYVALARTALCDLPAKNRAALEKILRTK